MFHINLQQESEEPLHCQVIRAVNILLDQANVVKGSKPEKFFLDNHKMTLHLKVINESYKHPLDTPDPLISPAKSETIVIKTPKAPSVGKKIVTQLIQITQPPISAIPPSQAARPEESVGGGRFKITVPARGKAKPLIKEFGSDEFKHILSLDLTQEEKVKLIFTEKKLWTRHIFMYDCHRGAITMLN